MATEDRMLIRRIKQGDKAAFEVLVQRHYQNIFAYCFRRTGNRQDAEDLTQEVFLKVIKAIYKYHYTGKFSNFLFTIAVNCVNDFYRRKLSNPVETTGLKDEQGGMLTDMDTDHSAYLEMMPDQMQEPGAEILRREERQTLYARLRGLAEPQKEALILYYFHGFKAREIAAMTGVSVATAKSRIRQGMEHLRKIYEKEER